MDKFLKIISERMEYYKYDLKSFYDEGNNVIDFCNLPFEEHLIRTNYKGKKELLNIIKRVRKIQNKLIKIFKD